ncbi:Cell wall / vacuolar inhibitor of fructosidase 2 [Linum perenne]
MKIKYVSIILLVLPIFLHQATAVAPPTLLEKTCRSSNNYTLCISSLQSDQRTKKATDVKGLASIELAIIFAKANDALVQYGNLLKNTSESGLYRSYGTCVEEFRGIVEGAYSSLRISIASLQLRKYKAAKRGLQDTKSHVAMCLQGLITRQNVFTNEAQLVDELSSVAISIIDLLRY